MTQSQTSAFMSSSFPYSAPMKGLSINREREREAARIERERQLQNAEPVSLTPLFPHPKKVQPSREDRLQHTIQATLGDFNALKPSMYQKQYSLLGITNKVPQTPVDAGNNNPFNFDNNLLNKKENAPDRNLAKILKAKPTNRTKDEKPRSDSNIKSTNTIKKTADTTTDQHIKTTKTVSKKLSDSDHPLLDSSLSSKMKDSKVSAKKDTSSMNSESSKHDQLVSKVSVKKETSSTSSEVPKHDEHVKKVTVKKEMSSTSGETSKHDQHISKVLVNKEISSTSSEAFNQNQHVSKVTVKTEMSSKSSEDPKYDQYVSKVSAKKETSCTGSEVPKQDQHVISNGIDETITAVKKEAKDITTKHKPPKLSINPRSPDHSLGSSEPNVKKILEEMTRPGPPPLTAIQTPRKNNAPFAFPHNISTSSLANGSPAGTATVKNEKEEQILQDLQITDDENTDDEGNDSSDDSDSSSDSDSDSSSDNSPLNSPIRSQLNKPAKSNKLNHVDKDTSKKHHLPSTTKASTTSSLNDTTEGGVRGNLAAPAAHTSPLNNTAISNDANTLSILSDYGLQCSDISKTMMEENLSGESNGFDTTLLANDMTLGDEEPINHFKPIEPHSNELKENDSMINVLSSKESSLTSDSLLKVSPKKETSVALSPKKEEVPKKEEALSTSVKKEPTIKKEHSHTTKKESSKSPKEVEKVKKEKPKLESTPKLNVSTKEKHEKTKSSTKKKTLESSSTKSSSKSSDNKDDSKTKKVEKTVEKKLSKTKKTSRIKKPVISDEGESEEVDVVTVSNDKPLLNKTNHVDSSKKHKTENKTKSKPVNGQKESSLNGHRNGSLNGHKHTSLDEKKELLSPLSPKNGLEEITLDCNSKPDALVVKIPLAWLKRIPLLKSQDYLGINTKIENGDEESSPPRKAAKHHLSVECSDSKKSKYEHTNGELKDSRRHNSTSSTHSEDYNRRKRSPSRESDSHYSNKRRRHDSENSKHEDQLLNGHSKMNGHSRIKETNLPQEHSQECFCDGKKEADKREAMIAKLYDPEPRVPHGPDHYLLEAKRVKHRADAIKDYTVKAYKYFESVLSFVSCGKALEQNNDTESRSAYQMYMETVEMLKYAMRLVSSKSSQDKKVDKRFIGLCLRLQSLLYMRLFKLRKDSMMKASRSLMDHFKGQAKTAQAPSPYNASNSKMTGTPSPMSPTPSPSGSIGSVGSVGSVGSGEAMTTPSRNGGRPSSSCMTSPVNMSIPQKIHTMTLQHLNFTNHMLYGYDAWEQSQMIFNENRGFFMDLDRNYGPITLQSSIVDVVEYMQQGYQKLQKELKT